MHPSRLRFGLIAWAFVWLLVALVPSWRLDAMRQLSNPGANTSFNAENYGLTHDLEREAARRFPDEIGAQLAPLHGVQFQDLYGPPPVPDETLPAQVYSLSNLDEAAKTIRQRAVPYFRRYDELERRFPDSNAVRAQRLRDTTAGQLVPHQGPWAKGETVPLGLETSRVWLAKPELEASLRTAVEGARREPDNGFFPWMQATLLFAMDKPNDAIQALDAAGKCARWSDGTNQTVIRRLALLHRLRVSNWQDNYWEAWSMLLPHFAPMLSAARATAGQMRLARRRGDEARALEIAGILQRAGSSMARCEDSLIGGLVGDAICGIAHKTTIEDLPDAPKRANSSASADEAKARHDIEELRRARLQAFVAYTRAHNRPDLAREALGIEKTIDAARLSWQSARSDMDNGSDPTLRTTIGLQIAFFLSMLLLWLSLAASLTWFGCWLFTMRREGNGQARAKTIGWSFFCLGATGALLGVLIRIEQMLKPDLFNFVPNINSPSSSIPGQPPVGLLTIPAILWLAPIVLSMAWERKRKWKPRWKLELGRPNLRQLTSRGLWIVCFVGASMFALSSPLQLAPALFYFWIVWLLCLLVGSVLFIAWASRERRLARIFGLASFWMGTLGVMLGVPREDNQLELQCIWDLALLMALAALFLSWRNRRVKGKIQLDWLFDFLGRVRIAASVLALGTTLGYLGIALWTMPVEARAKAQLDRQLQIGEPAFLREQLPTKNPAPS